MNLRNDTAMRRTLQTDKCAKLLNNLKEAICQNPKSTVLIHFKVTLSIKEANQYTEMGINSIEDRLREPNCPFVLFIGAKKMIKCEEYISKTFIF